MTAYGINGETIVGKLILGEELGIYNSSGSLKFNKDGFLITNGINSFTVNPNNPKKLLALSKSGTDILYVDEKGMLHLKGDGSGLDISSNGSISGLSNRITANEEGIRLEIKRATGAEGELSTRINTTADGIAAEIKRATAVEGELSNQIKITADGLSAEIKRANKTEGELSNKISVTASGLDAEITRANEVEGKLSTRITANAEGLSLRVEKNGVISAINASSESISINASKINLNGVITANKTFQIKTDGSMVCTGGTIAGWNINSTSIYRGNANIGASGGMYFGNNGLSVSNKFKVDAAGNLAANGANITGAINATSMTAYNEYRLYVGSKDYSIIRAGNWETGTYKEIEFGFQNGVSGGKLVLVENNGLPFLRFDDIFTIQALNADLFLDSISIQGGNLLVDRGHGVFTTGPYGAFNVFGITGKDNIYIGDRASKTSESLQVMKNCFIVAENVIKRGSGSDVTLSDERFKTHVHDINNAEQFIMNLKPKMYKFTDGTSDRYHTGFLAGEVKQTMDSTLGDFGVYMRYTFDEDTPIDPNNSDTYISGLRYDEFIAPHIKVTQEHNKRIIELQEENKQLKAKIFRIEQLLENFIGTPIA